LVDEETAGGATSTVDLAELVTVHQAIRDGTAGRDALLAALGEDDQITGTRAAVRQRRRWLRKRYG
jgi:hypothetical protein